MLLSAVLSATTYREKAGICRQEKTVKPINFFYLNFNELYVAVLRQRKRTLSENDYRDEKPQKTKNPAEAGFKIGRRERIRTSDPLVPNQLRYQAALLADVLLFEFLVQFI